MPPLFVAALVVFLESLSLSALFPVIDAHVRTLGGATQWTGAIFALVSAPKIFFNPFWGRAADRFGRRPVLIACGTGAILGSVGWALAPGLIWLAAARVVTGVFGAQQILATAVAADVSRPERRAAAMAALGAGFALAFTFGPPVGGLLAASAGGAAVGWLCAGLQLVSLLLVCTTLRETRPAQASTPTAAVTPPARLSGAALAVIVAGALVTLGLSQLITAFSPFTRELYGFDERWSGYALGLFGVLAAVGHGMVRPLAGRIGDRQAGALGIALAVAGLAWGAAEPGLGQAAVVLTLVALGTSIATTCLTALLSRLTASRDQGRVFGLNQSAGMIGRAVGFFLGGVWYRQVGPGAPFGSAAVCLALALLLVGWRRSAVAASAHSG